MKKYPKLPKQLVNKLKLKWELKKRNMKERSLDYPKWYAGWDKNEIITKFEDNKSYLKALGRERK